MVFRSLAPFSRSTVPARDEFPGSWPFRRDLKPWFEDMFKSAGMMPSAWGKGMATPLIDVRELPEGIEITAELPGVDEKDVEVELVDDLLTIRGEKKIEREEGNKEKGFHVMERAYGSFQRSVRLPFSAESNRVSAQFSKGVLKIVCPRPAEIASKSRRISIRSE